MPNWVHHQLTVTGPEAERERFLAECFSQTEGETNFDFDRLIPQPEHIKRDLAKREQREVGFTDAKAKFPDWYEWRCKNWGDKWNACDTDVGREGEAIRLFFDTAWSVPIPIFEEVARRFPSLKIEGTYQDGMLNFAGNILCQNGTVAFEDRSEECDAAYEAMMAQYKKLATEQ